MKIPQCAPEYDSRFRRTPPPRPTGNVQCGRMRTTLKSTVCSAYGSNDDWHTLGSHSGQIYGWEAPCTTLVYTTHIHSTCIEVGQDAPHRRKRVRNYRGSLGHLCSPSCFPIAHAVYGDGQAQPVPSLSFWSAPGTQQRSQSSRLRLRGRPTQQPSSIGLSCAPLKPQTATTLAVASVVVMIRDVCAILGAQAATFAVGIDLWRSSQKRLSVGVQ